jgi:xanthine dehydrogenase accessory factor
LFERERRAGRAMALGILVETVGSSYQKSGAVMLITADGEYAGLFSGGCVETDLCEHAAAVIASGQARTVRYDTRSPDELLWGLGLGCEGAMRILLLPVGPDTGWQPLQYLAGAHSEGRTASVGIVCDSAREDVPLGALLLPPSEPLGAATAPGLGGLRSQLSGCRASQWHRAEGFSLFLLPVSPAPHVLLLGAGPDAAPLVDLAARLWWRVTVADHRPARADPARFPAAAAVVLMRPENLATTLDLTGIAGAVVMSHHLPSDLAYLRALGQSEVPYVGLLGPAARRDRLLADLGPLAARLRPRLHAPVGLPLGGRSPESLALAIVAQLHAQLHAEPEVRAPARIARASGAD